MGRWEAAIYPEYGAALTALTCEGQELLRTPEDMGEWRKSPYLYGNPLLLPPNRTRDGVFTFRGNTYTLPVNEPDKKNHIHGLLFDAPFSVTERWENGLCCSYQNCGERYPFHFTVSFCYQISTSGLKVDLSLKNDGNTAMPLVLGFHTTFSEPQSFAVPIKERWERDERLLPTGRLLPLSTEEAAIKTGCSYHGIPLTGCFTSDGHTAKIGDFLMETSEEFDQWVLYNGGGKDGYLCVEPQTGPVNGLNIPGGARVLEAGETFHCWLRFGLFDRQRHKNCFR